MKPVRVSPATARHAARVLETSPLATLLVRVIARLRDGADTYDTHVEVSELERTLIVRELERAPAPSHPKWMKHAIETFIERLEST